MPVPNSLRRLGWVGGDFTLTPGVAKSLDNEQSQAYQKGSVFENLEPGTPQTDSRSPSPESWLTVLSTGFQRRAMPMVYSQPHFSL